MLEALVSDLLNQYLGQFIENIDSKQLGTSVLSGSLKLTNMTLKPSLFDNSPLPFSLQFGRVGRIYIKIPFWDMFKSPLVVEIEDIFGFVTFKQWRDWDVGLQRKAFQEANQDLLAQYELFLKNKFVLEQSKRESSASFSEKLVARIMDNLRVSIKNVYFRFEDSYAISVNLGNGESRTEKEKFSIGMTLKEFSIFTTDKSYQSVQEKKRSGKRVKREKAVDDEEKLTFKTIKLEGFAVFCNWADVEARIDLQKLREQTLAKDTTYIQEILHDEAEDKFENKYFLHDLNIQLNLQLNNDLKNPLAPATLSFPQYKAELIVGSINAGSAPAHLSLFQPQVLRFLKIFERIGVFNEFRDGTVASFLEKKLSPQEKQQYLAAFIQYLNASNELEKETSKSKKDNKQIVEATRRKMKEIEDQVDHKQIIELRNQGHERVRNEDGRQSSLDKVEERIQAEMSEQIGFGLFLSASKKSKIEREVRQKYQPMIDAIKSKYDSEDDKISENIQNLLMDLKDDGDEDDEELLDFSLLPGDYVQLELTMLVPRLSFSLINEFNQELFTVGLLGFELHHKQANDRRASSLSLKEFNVQDQWIKSPTWPRLMDTVPVDAAQQSGEALAVLFDQDKDFKECPFKVKIAARKSCHMVLNIQLMNEVMRTMSIAMKNEKLDFNYFTEMALNQINQMRKRAKEYAENIQSGDYMHQNADIEADILAPVVILPQDIFDPYQRYIKADLGRITVGSQLQVYDKKKDYKREQEESALYDIYMLGLNKINLQVIEYVDHEQKHRKIMQDVTLGMTIRNCLEPLHPIYPTFKIDAKAETPISIEIVDVFDLAMRLLELKESLLVQLYSKDYNAIEKKKLADFNVQARMAKGVNDFQQIEEPGEDQEATKLIRQTRTKSRKLADDDDEAGGEEQYRQIVESRLRGDRRGAATNDSVNIQEQEKSSLAEEAGAPEGDGTNVQFRLHVPQMRIVLGTQDHNAYDERRKADIKLHETDRFIFEVRELSMLTNMDKQTSTITVEMGVQKLEIREEFGGVLDEEGDQQNQEQDKMEANEAMIKERAAGKEEFGQYGNLFKKMVFWNEKQIIEEPELHNIEQDPQDVRFDNHQMQARIELKTAQQDDPVYGLVVHQDVKVDLLLRQTILMANLETQRRVILALGRLVDVLKFDEMNAKETYQLARNDMYSALRTINSGPNAVAENIKYKYIGTLFKNLASMVGQAGPSQLPQFLNSIEKMLESDEDMQALQAFAKKAEMLQQESDEKEQGQRSRRALIKAASVALFKASENKRVVEYQQHVQQKVFLTMNISSIELWLCDFKKNQAEYSNIHQMAQVLQFKFGQDLEVNMKQFVKQLLVRKKRQEHADQEDKVVFTETKYETVNKLVKQDDAIKFNLHQIQIAQKIFGSWESASELLLSDELLPAQTSNMLSPTDVSIEVSTQSELNLDRAQHIKISLEPINLSQDYKDIQLLYTLLQRYQRTIEPSMAIFVDQIEEKINEVREKLKKNFKEAVEESLYQQRWTRMMSANKEQDEGSDDEAERIEDPIADRLDIRAHNQQYVKSIDFRRGSEVQTNMPQLFRKDSKAIEIKIPQIQIKFCDGLLTNFQTQDLGQGIPLVLCRFEDLQLDVWQIDHDLSFDPLTGLRSHTITNRQHADFEIAEQKPPYLAVAMSLRLEATYFNQLTQYFEPFIEAWTVKQEITQKNKHSPFDVSLKSSDLLNMNVTYGMAASLRNIQNEVNEILRRVDEQMMVDDKLEKERGDKRQTLKLLQKENAQRRFTDQTQARFGAANYATQSSQRAAAPQEADPFLGEDPEPIHANGASDRLLKYTIVNHTGLDISIMNATQKMAIQKNLGGGLTEEELANFQENQVIDIVCDEIEGGRKDALFQPQLQKAQVELDQLFQRSRDEVEIVQLEDDIDKINFKLTGEFQKHGAEGVHEFSKVQIEKNGIYGYESVVHDPAEMLSTMRSSSQSSSAPARQPSALEDHGFEHAMLPMDVIMSITSKGTQRTISFESQMVISNNTEFPITLCFTFQHLANLADDAFGAAQLQDPAQDPNSAGVRQLDELLIDLAEFAEFKVPLKWYAMTNDKDRQTKINMYLVKKKEGSSHENDESGEKYLVFEDITRKFRGKPKDVIKQDIKAKIVELHSDLYISVDVHGYACLPEHTKDKNPVQFLLQLNPPLVLYNKTMCALQVFEIDFPGTPQEESKLQSKIPAGMSDSLFQLDVLDAGEDENKPDITLKFFDNDTEQRQGQRTVICKTLTSLQKYSDFDQDKDQINSSSKAQRPTNELTYCEDFERHRDVDLDQGKPADLDAEVVKLQIHCSKRSKNIQSQYSHHQGSVSADNLLRECIIEETKALQLSIYPKYMIVNKTSHDLRNGDQRIKAMHSDFLRLEEKDSRVALFADDYRPSQPIDLNQIGMTGVITMDGDAQDSRQLQFGVNIQSAPSPFNMTIVLTVVPRYLIVNKLGKNVVLRQYRKMKKVQGQEPPQDNTQAVNSFQSEVNPLDGLLKTEFHFRKAKPRHTVQPGAPDNLIQFRIVDDELARDAEDKREEGPVWMEKDEDSLWTLPFSVDQLDDFQTQLRDQEAEAIANAQELEEQQNLLWTEPSRNNNHRRVVRVIITSNSQDDDATLLIILENPATEEFLIKNKTGITLQFHKYDKAKRRILDEVPAILEGYKSMPFVWDNRDINDKQVLILAPKKKATASLDQVSKYDQKKKEPKRNNLFRLAVRNSQDPQPRLIQLYSTLKVNQMSTKILTIYHRELDPEKRAAAQRTVRNLNAQDSDEGAEESKQHADQAQEDYLGIDQNHLTEYEDPESAKGAKGINFSVHLKGMGISMIDNQPKELLYATLSDLKVDFKMSTSVGRIRKKNNDRLIQTKMQLRLSIGNLQVDNMLDDEMSVLFCPTKLYKDLVLTERNYDEMGPLQREYRAIEPIDKVLKKRDGLVEQVPKKAREDEERIPFVLVSIVKNTKSYEQKIGSVVRFDEIHCAMQEFSVQVNTGMIINTVKFMIQTMYLFEQDQEMNYVSELTSMQFEESSQKKLHEICPFMDSSKGVQIDEDQINVNKLSYGIIMLGSIKSTFNITLDKSKVEDLKLIYESVGKSGVVYLIGPLLQSFASVSDLAIQFHELIILESFISQDMLVKNISNHYKYQIKSQMFRILGSSNLLGNPAGLLDKVGHGVFQMARDPIVGMSQGPTAFVKGVGTGMQGLVKGVIGGSFNSLGNITGSMYAVIKTTTGQEDNRSAQKATGVVSGVKQGVKGFGSELFSGVSGIVKRPAEGAKKGGLKGFVKGVGKGIVGAVATPVTGTLRAGESVAQGISGTATSFSNVGKSVIQLLDPKTVRVRESRRVDLKGRISCYNEDLAIVNFYLLRIKKGMMADQQIRYFETLPDPAADGSMRRGRANLLVLTTDYLLVMRPQNFSIGKQATKLDQSVILLERLSNIYEYKVLMSQELHLEPKAGKSSEPQLVQAGFFLVVVAAVDAPAAGAGHAQGMRPVDLAAPSQAEVQVDQLSPQDLQAVAESELRYDLGDSLPSGSGNIRASEPRMRSSTGYSLRGNTAVQVIENQSLTTITSKLHKNFKVEEFYNEIADFGYLKVGKVNGQNLTRDSLLVQMFRSADISHTSTTTANELGDAEEERPDQIQVRVQNPQQLYKKLHRLATRPKRRTVIYSDRFEVFDRVFQLVDKAIPEAKENALVLNQLRKEMPYTRRAEAAKGGQRQ